MGEKQNQPFHLLFNASLKVDFQGSRVTSNGGLILVRELDERLGLEKLIEEHLSDSRQGMNKQFTLADLLRQSVYSRLAGYEDLKQVTFRADAALVKPEIYEALEKRGMKYAIRIPANVRRARTSRRNPADRAGACSGSKFVVS